MVYNPENFRDACDQAWAECSAELAKLSRQEPVTDAKVRAVAAALRNLADRFAAMDPGTSKLTKPPVSRDKTFDYPAPQVKQASPANTANPSPKDRYMA